MSVIHALLSFFSVSGYAHEACDSKMLLQASRTTAVAATESCTDYTQQYSSYDSKKVNSGRDKDGDGCDFYQSYTEECGKHDDDDFIANEMCCSCGGGSTYKGSRSLAVNQASVLMSQGSDCPEGFEPITSLAACRAALDIVGISGGDFGGSESDKNWPRGCYYCKNVQDCSNGVWFNKDSTGESISGTRRLCHKNFKAADVKVLFVGDSDIDYWDSAVAFPGSFNVGVGGYTTKDVQTEVDQWVADLSPTWVVIVCGENDLDGKRKTTEDAFKRFKQIVDKFIGNGARVIYLGTKPEPDTKNLHREYEFYDSRIRTFATAKAKESPGSFQMVDVFRSFTSKKELYNSDKLHMSRLGYKFWNGWVKLAMESTTPCVLWMDGVCLETP
eukprot:TRINITY_DN15562_c0_g1_i1.p1 TRINITY_DN15562_c0_g1~~TRINITY_DN15562_c0_g1_i1.p1  ORF type:complete len:415 (-),score=72.51 TRINITY_DN15562_c0_g1_i1:426-1586(-)